MKKHSRKATNWTIWISIILVSTLIVAIFTKYKSIEDLTKPRDQEKVDPVIKNIVLNNAPKRGALEPSVIIAEFGDFQCEYCKEEAPIIKQVQNKYPTKVQTIWFHTLNPAHGQAKAAAIASQCAFEQNRFWEYHDKLFENQDQLSPVLFRQIATELKLDLPSFQQCLADEQTAQIVELHHQFALENGVDATPYINVNDDTISGLFSAQELESLVKKHL